MTTRGRHHPRMDRMEATARMHASGHKRTRHVSRAPSAEWVALQAISAEMRQSRQGGGTVPAELRERYNAAFAAHAAANE